MGVKLTWSNVTLDADISITNGDLTEDEGLETMAIICSFTDRRANDDDILPDYNSPQDPGSGDRRGWWGDHYSMPIVAALLASTARGIKISLPPVTRLGSRLWLLERAEASTDTLNRAVFYMTEGLQPFIDYGIASSVEVTARYLSRDAMYLHPRIIQGNSALLDRQYAYAWRAMAGNAAAPSPGAITPRLVPPPPGPVNPWV